MSDEFIEMHFPCDTCLVQATCIHQRMEKYKDKKFERISVLGIPKIDGKTYHKGLFECWANLGHRLYCNMDKIDDQGTIRKHNIPTPLAFLVGELGGLAQWISNSTSWQKGKLQDFDRDEIKQKLRFIERTL